MISQLIFLQIGWVQIAIIAVIVLLLFGGRKIPELMKGLGGGLKEFKKASKDDEEDASKPPEQVTEKNQPKQQTPPVKEEPASSKGKK